MIGDPSQPVRGDGPPQPKRFPVVGPQHTGLHLEKTRQTPVITPGKNQGKCGRQSRPCHKSKLLHRVFSSPFLAAPWCFPWGKPSATDSTWCFPWSRPYFQGKSKLRILVFLENAVYGNLVMKLLALEEAASTPAYLRAPAGEHAGAAGPPGRGPPARRHRRGSLRNSQKLLEILRNSQKFLRNYSQFLRNSQKLVRTSQE